MQKKIVFLLSSLSQGGSERQMLNTAKMLQEEGSSVHVLTYHSSDFYGIGNNENGIEYLTVESNNSIKRIFKLRKELKRIKPDYIVTLCGIPSVYTLLASVGLKEKVVLNWRNNNTSQFEGINGLLYSAFSKKITCIICNSHNGYDIWASKRPKEIGKLKVIYNLVQIGDVQNAGREPDDSFTILIPARICPDKNPEGVIKAVSLLPDSYKRRLQIEWVGRPDKGYGDEIIKLAEENTVGNVLRFKEATKEIEREILKADAVGLFSHREGFPNAICEAMILSKPVIMTPVSDYKILCSDNGVLCDSDSGEDICKAIMCLLDKTREEIISMEISSKGKADTFLNCDLIKEQWIGAFR